MRSFFKLLLFSLLAFTLFNGCNRGPKISREEQLNIVREIIKEVGTLSDTVPTNRCSFRNDSLVSLTFFEDRVDSLHKIISKFSYLEDLTISYCRLKKLPAEIGALKNFKLLKLAENKLKDIPEEVGDLTNLTILIINNNELKELPDEFYNLLNLDSLDLEYNKLRVNRAV